MPGRKIRGTQYTAVGPKQRMKYRAPDGSTYAHKVPWTKAERAAHEREQEASAARVMNYITRGNCRNALAVLLSNERAEAHGITTGAHIDSRDAFRDRCLKPQAPGELGRARGARARARR